MKNNLRFHNGRTILLATAFVLAELLDPLTAKAANKNVWIETPVDTSQSPQSMTVCIGETATFTARTSYPVGSTWSWSDATLQGSPSDHPVSTATRTFSQATQVGFPIAVTATYNNEISYAANVTVVDPASLNFSHVEFKRSDESDQLYDATGGGDVADGETFIFRPRMFGGDAILNEIGPKLKWWILDGATVLASGTGVPFSAAMSGTGSRLCRIWFECDGNGIWNSNEPSTYVIFTVVPIKTFWLTITRHINVTFSQADADFRLAEATTLLRTRDQIDDRRCAIELRRLGSLTTFSSAPAVVNNQSDMEAVFNVPGNVKILLDINYPVDAMGLTKLPLGQQNSMIVSLPVKSTWAHEFGHQQSLDHSETIPDHRIMYDGNLNSSNTISDQERDTIRNFR